MIDAPTFFHIADVILEASGRKGFSKDKSYTEIIAVLPEDEVLQIIAGPGSGKTEIITWRALYELIVLGTSSEKIIVTTFTRRGATELQVRVVERCDAFLQAAHAEGVAVSDPHVHDIRIGTIHRLCDCLLAELDPDYMAAGTMLVDEMEALVRLARSYRFALGYSTGGARLVNRLLDNRALVSLFRPPWEHDNWPTSNMDRVSFLQALLAQQVETWEPRCGDLGATNGVQTVHGPTSLTEDLVQLRERWEKQYLAKENILDFATIQKRFLERQHAMQGHFSHVFVDEFQDTNPIQFVLHAGWLTGGRTRLTVVGDDDQAIYRFRGSDIACFQGLQDYCRQKSVRYRTGKLETNYRSTKNIVGFIQGFKATTSLKQVSMPKTISAEGGAKKGRAVRLLAGPWPDVCKVVALELDSLGAGHTPLVRSQANQTAAVLMFSTSERSSTRHAWTAPALTMRHALESQGIRAYNPRSKTAAEPGSPVGMLLGLISYLIDPVTMGPVGKGGRSVMVWACNNNPTYQAAAMSRSPSFRVNQRHIDYQKRFRKPTGSGITPSPADRKVVLDFIDTIRDRLAKLSGKVQGRLTLAGLVARLLAQPFFRNCGFSLNLFRQALFTQLLEANIAPTRLTRKSLDSPLEVALDVGKYRWPDRYWELLGHFGALLENSKLDDLEVESFEEDAVLLITYHQAKGLEFDHVFVSGAGREPDVTPVLRTRLFSGKAVRYDVTNGAVVTADREVRLLAKADRDREVYVALTRAKESLTILQDTRKPENYMRPNPTIQALFRKSRKKRHPRVQSVSIWEWTHA